MLVDHLEMLVAARAGRPCLEGLVLEHGRLFEWDPRVKVEMGERQQCYMNAGKLAMDRGHVYVEGYARVGVAPIPVHHAWCLDARGRVLDPTWPVDLLGKEREYCGVPLSNVYWRAALIRKRTWGVMEDWESGYPILRDPPSEWLDASGCGLGRAVRPTRRIDDGTGDEHARLDRRGRRAVCRRA